MYMLWRGGVKLVVGDCGLVGGEKEDVIWTGNCPRPTRARDSLTTVEWWLNLWRCHQLVIGAVGSVSYLNDNRLRSDNCLKTQ